MSSFTTEPRCWRRFAGPGGARMTLKPDAHLVVELDDYADRWFIEVDCGTESSTTLARKCETYRRYWQTGIEHQQHEVFPRVLWLVPDAKRYSTLVDVFGRQPAEAWPLFTVALMDDAVARIRQGADV